MTGVFLVTFQVCLPLEGPGPSHRRKPEQTALVVAERAEQIGEVIAANVPLEPGEQVHVTQQRQLEPSRKVFFRKADA